MNSEFEKSGSLRIELISCVNALVAAKLILSEGKYRELKERIPNLLRDWIYKHSESIEKWSKQLCAISHTDMAPLTEKQRCQVMVEALHGFKEASLEAKRIFEDYNTENYLAPSQNEFFQVILRIDEYLDSLQSISREKKPEHCS